MECEICNTREGKTDTGVIGVYCPKCFEEHYQKTELILPKKLIEFLLTEGMEIYGSNLTDRVTFLLRKQWLEIDSVRQRVNSAKKR